MIVSIVPAELEIGTKFAVAWHANDKPPQSLLPEAAQTLINFL
jgi:hypothetical protein